MTSTISSPHRCMDSATPTNIGGFRAANNGCRISACRLWSSMPATILSCPQRHCPQRTRFRRRYYSNSRNKAVMPDSCAARFRANWIGCRKKYSVSFSTNVKETLINSPSKMRCKADGAQEMRHIMKIGKFLSTTQRSRSLV